MSQKNARKFLLLDGVAKKEVATIDSLVVKQRLRYRAKWVSNAIIAFAEASKTPGFKLVRVPAKRGPVAHARTGTVCPPEIHMLAVETAATLKISLAEFTRCAIRFGLRGERIADAPKQKAIEMLDAYRNAKNCIREHGSTRARDVLDESDAEQDGADSPIVALIRSELRPMLQKAIQKLIKESGF